MEVTTDGDPTADALLDLFCDAMRGAGFHELSIRRAINRATAWAILDADGATGG